MSEKDPLPKVDLQDYYEKEDKLVNRMKLYLVLTDVMLFLVINALL